MSTLHKQNFDLKLELFHRRERQTVLEQKIETLEANLVNVEQSNLKMVQELEKRDKAVEEAVHMIVSLEARIELLLRERKMAQQVEANKNLLSQLDDQSPTTTLANHGATKRLQNDAAPAGKSLNRMPSFLSERTENTENLRNVYLEPKTSYLSLAKLDSRAGNNGFVSPSMSILSESSFLSVYGQRNTNGISSRPDIPSTIQSRLTSNGQRSASLPTRTYTTTRAQSGDELENRSGFKNYQDLEAFPAPAQRREKLDASPQVISQTIPSLGDNEASTTVRPGLPQILPRARKESERPVRRLLTDDPGGSHHGLPPTPDTMTSSMMNGQSQISDSSLRRNLVANDPTRYPVISRLTLEQTDQVEPGHWRFKSPDIAQPPSVTAFTGRKEASGAAAYYENRLPALRRPRSADETTVSRHKNEWDSCSDVDDLCSEASSFDYWMKEGLRPSRGGTTKAQNRTFSSQLDSSRDPADLFSFPSDGKSWRSGEIFGALGGTGHLGVESPIAPALDALGASLPTPEAGLYGSGLAGTSSTRAQGAAAAPPPAPYRRSSLKAHTSALGTPTTSRASGSHKKLSNFDSRRDRSVSGPDLGNPKQIEPMSNSSHSKSPTAVKRHYPPHASQSQATPRPRSRGITSLFRRSLGSATPQPSASVPPMASQSPFSPPPATTKNPSPSAVGVPAWERRNEFLENGSSATPPPIMRNRGEAGTKMDSGNGRDEEGAVIAGYSRMARGSDFSPSTSGLGSGLSKVITGQDGGVALTPTRDQTSDQEHEIAHSSQGHGRRWFNLTRVTNHQKNGFGGGM